MNEESRMEMILQNIEYKKALTKLFNLKVSEKQQARRDFVLRFLIENPSEINSYTTFEDTHERVLHAIKVFEQADSDLSDIEKKEREQ